MLKNSAKDDKRAVSNPNLFNKPFKTVAENKNGPKIFYQISKFQVEKNEI